MIKTIQMPSKKETLTVIVIMALFLLLTAACIGFYFLPDYLPGSWQWPYCLSPFSGSRMTGCVSAPITK